MIIVKMNAYEKADIIKYLEMAKEFVNHRPKPKGPNKWDDTRYDLNRINQLEDVINGLVDEECLLMNSREFRMKNAKKTSKKSEEIPIDLPFLKEEL